MGRHPRPRTGSRAHNRKANPPPPQTHSRACVLFSFVCSPSGGGFSPPPPPLLARGPSAAPPSPRGGAAPARALVLVAGGGRVAPRLGARLDEERREVERRERLTVEASYAFRADAAPRHPLDVAIVDLGGADAAASVVVTGVGLVAAADVFLLAA